MKKDACDIKNQYPLFYVSLRLTLFFPMFPFDPPENIRKPLGFGCFQGDQEGTLGRKGLNLHSHQFIL